MIRYLFVCEAGGVNLVAELEDFQETERWLEAWKKFLEKRFPGTEFYAKIYKVTDIVELPVTVPVI